MVKQQRPGHLKGKVTFCMPWTSSSHSLDWEHLHSCYSLKWSWFRQNPTAEGDIPHVTTHNTWVLPSALVTVCLKGRTPRSPHVTAGDREAQSREDPCMAESRLTVPILQQSVGQLSLNPDGIQDLNHISWCSFTFPQGPKAWLSHLGLHRLSCCVAEHLMLICTLPRV